VRREFQYAKCWRPLTQDELPYLASGDTLTLRLNYLYNPERLPVTYAAALCVEKRKRDGTFLPEGSDTPIEISLTEAGRYADDGWQMTGEGWLKLRLGDMRIPVHVGALAIWASDGDDTPIEAARSEVGKFIPI
jgi:hypothetical protein